MRPARAIYVYSISGQFIREAFDVSKFHMSDYFHFGGFEDTRSFVVRLDLLGKMENPEELDHTQVVNRVNNVCGFFRKLRVA